MTDGSLASELVDNSYDPLNNFDFIDTKDKDIGLVATFHKVAVKNNFRSQTEQRPIFEEKEFVRIERVGDKTTVIDREASDFDKARFARQYAAFLRGEDSQLQGMPIESMPNLTKVRIAELKALNVHTIEALAGVPDSALNKIGMDAQKLREKAREVLAVFGKQWEMEQVTEKATAAVMEQIRGAGMQIQAPADNTRLNALEEQVLQQGAMLEGIGGMLQQLLAAQQMADAKASAEAEESKQTETPKQKEESHAKVGGNNKR